MPNLPTTIKTNKTTIKTNKTMEYLQNIHGQIFLLSRWELDSGMLVLLNSTTPIYDACDLSSYFD